MAAEKMELAKRTVTEFMKLNEDNKMFILGYMTGVSSRKKCEEKGCSSKKEE